MKIKKVRKVVVTTEDGTVHTFKGIEGHAIVRSINYVGAGIKNQPYQERLDLSLTFAPKEDVKA